MQRASVDLPQPVSPTSPSTSPLATVRSTSSTALRPSGSRRRTWARNGCRRGKYLRSARTSSKGSPPAGTVRPSGIGHHRRPRRSPPRNSANGCRLSRAHRPPAAEGRPRCGSRPRRRGSGGGNGSRAVGTESVAAHPVWSSASARRARNAAPSAAAPACRGAGAARKTSPTAPISTICAAYITATRWHSWATTARSWVT